MDAAFLVGHARTVCVYVNRVGGGTMGALVMHASVYIAQ